MLNIGDWVYINPKFFGSGNVDTTRGIITARQSKWDKDIYEVDWEDGEVGQALFNEVYLLKV